MNEPDANKIADIADILFKDIEDIKKQAEKTALGACQRAFSEFTETER